MKKLLLALLLFPAIARADCSDYGLYAFALYGCPERELGVDISIPLCEQEQWKHLAYYDARCYVEVPFNWSKSCNEWDCPVPYVHVWREPISGREKKIWGSWQEVDWNYRAARSQIPKKPTKK